MKNVWYVVEILEGQQIYMTRKMPQKYQYVLNVTGIIMRNHCLRYTRNGESKNLKDYKSNSFTQHKEKGRYL